MLSLPLLVRTALGVLAGIALSARGREFPILWVPRRSSSPGASPYAGRCGSWPCGGHAAAAAERARSQPERRPGASPSDDRCASRSRARASSDTKAAGARAFVLDVARVLDAAASARHARVKSRSRRSPRCCGGGWSRRRREPRGLVVEGRPATTTALDARAAPGGWCSRASTCRCAGGSPSIAGDGLLAGPRDYEPPRPPA